MVSNAIASNKGKAFIMRKGISTLSDLRDGASVYGYPGDYYGQIYYVNNITGDSSFDGLSWATPFDEVSTAITASETFRALPSGSTNDYQRNVIYVQGTGTPYAIISAMPSYCDLIGIGANPRGNGAGIVRIMGNTSADSIAGSARGLYMANFLVGDEVTSGSAGYSMDLAVCFRSTFENCVFVNKTTGGVRIGAAGGVTFKNCQIGGGDTANGTTGFTQTGVNFNNCVIEDCYIHGTDYGMVIAAEGGNNTWIRRNFIYGNTIGVDDNSVSGLATQGIIYTGNYVFSGSDCFSITTEGSYKAIGNHANQGGTTNWEDAHG